MGVILSLDKMATILQTTISKHEKYCILIRISIKFVSKGPIDNEWALGWAMTRPSYYMDVASAL